jgi:CheY-like chemotaxis protein
VSDVQSEMTNPTILILEDDGVLRKQLSRYLGRHGFAVTATASIREFRASLASSRFAAVLLDLSLPDGDGVEAWAGCRTEHPEATALLMTAQAGPEVSERAGRAGIAAVLDKPLCVSALLGLLGSASPPC